MDSEVGCICLGSARINFGLFVGPLICMLPSCQSMNSLSFASLLCVDISYDHR